MRSFVEMWMDLETVIQGEVSQTENDKYHMISLYMWNLKKGYRGFPGGSVVRTLPANAGDMGSSPGLGRSHMPWNG